MTPSPMRFAGGGARRRSPSRNSPPELLGRMLGHHPERHPPDFFILGAAKCGTTTLFHYLRQSPEIFMPRVKEPKYFCETHPFIHDPWEYLYLFRNAQPGQRLGEASHAYLTQPASARMIHDVLPRAKFILILRHPAERAYSLYHHMRRLGFEPAPTFEEALRLEDERAASPRFLRRCKDDPWNFLYFRSGLFGEQLARYLDLFPREQFHCLRLKDLNRDPEGTLADLCRFLGVGPFRPRSFAVRNAGERTARWPALQVWARERVEPAGPVFRKLALRIRSANLVPRPPVDPETHASLARRFEGDLERLAALTGLRDL